MPPHTIFMEGCLNGNIEVWMGWMKAFKILLKDVVSWLLQKIFIEVLPVTSITVTLNFVQYTM